MNARIGRGTAALLCACVLMLALMAGANEPAWADECPAGGTHTFKGSQPVRPTATTEGLRQYTCTKCGYTYTVTVPVTGHVWEEWTVERAATCTSEGLEYRLCAKCGQREDAVLPMLSPTGEHTWIESARTNATCTAGGAITYTCSVCGATKTEALPALGHNWGEWWVMRQATETEEGEEVRVCLNDVSHAETRPIEKLVPAPEPVQPGGTAAPTPDFFTAPPDATTQALGTATALIVVGFILASLPFSVDCCFCAGRKRTASGPCRR